MSQVLNDLLDSGDADERPVRPRVRRKRPLLAILAAIAFGVLVLAAVGWKLTGGSWFLVATPSMGQAAPVGTLILTQDVQLSDVTVGDIVTFQPPGTTDMAHTHRVVAINDDGTLRTQGDINGAVDPWAIDQADLIGVVEARLWGVGWLIRALPMLLLGGIVLWAGTRYYANDTWRGPIRVFGASLLVSIAAFLLRPFIGASVLMSVAPDDDSAVITLVSTGILPTRLSTTGDGFVDLVNGEVGDVIAAGPQGESGYPVTGVPHMPWQWWVILILIWLLPTVYALLRSPETPPTTPDDFSGSDDTDDASPAVARKTRNRHRRPGAPAGKLVAGSIIAALAAMMVGSVAPSTASAYTAQITNSIDKAGSAPYFTCRAAAVGLGAYYAYPLAETVIISGVTGAADANSVLRNGSYVGATSTPAPSDKGCVRDAGGSIVMSGTTAAIRTPTTFSNPNVFSTQIWFKTTSTNGGRLIGFGNSTALSTSTQYDRHLYLANNGQVVFGVYPSAVKTINSTASYNDGAWHQAVATLSTAGMALYVDGALVAQDATTTTGENYSGTWRIGYDNLNSWGSTQPNNFYFTGSLAYAAVFTTALTAAQVRILYVAGR